MKITGRSHHSKGFPCKGFAALIWFCAVLAPVWAQPSFTADGVTNAAGYQNAGVSPGEVVVIFGANLGPAEVQTLEVSGDRVTTMLGDVRVLFDGVPAPLVYVVAQQVSAVVPYSVTPGGTTDIQVEYNGETSATVTVPTLAAVPAIFTADASGKGQGAILNQDLTVNSADNPADLDKIVVIYATGEGATDPMGQDGAVLGAQGATIPAPVAPVNLTILDEDAEILYSAGAPGLVAGVLQVNAKVPPTTSYFVDREVRLQVGDQTSPRQVTVSVLSLPDPLAPGETIPLYGLTDDDRWHGSISADLLHPFEVRDGAGQLIFSGQLQDRVLKRNIDGTAVIGPMVRDMDDHGSGARVVRVEKDGFAGVEIKAEYVLSYSRMPAYQASRSADGDTVSFYYDPNEDFKPQTAFPYAFLPTAEWDYGAVTRIWVQGPDGTQYSAEIDNTVRPPL